MANIRHFKLEEFASPDEKGSGSNMDIGFLQMLDNAREIAGIPFKINSGFRTTKHNKKVGGKKSSSHLRGLACDIACSDGITRQKITSALIKAGFRRLGIADTFIHCDNDNDKNASIWLY
tara:strand:- start:357 stop:716 length:360 start_codon:yes stop_codon:yes gene_type:complete